jgi:hypothetical protein
MRKIANDKILSARIFCLYPQVDSSDWPTNR